MTFSKITNNLAYLLVHGIARILSYLPFWMLYLLSDFMYLMIFYVVGYRRQLVMKNLRMAFQEKTEQELKAIRRQFYHWFCDYIVETIKLLTISNEQMLRHIEFRGIEELEKA